MENANTLEQKTENAAIRLVDEHTKFYMPAKDVLKIKFEGEQFSCNYPRYKITGKYVATEGTMKIDGKEHVVYVLDDLKINTI